MTQVFPTKLKAKIQEQKGSKENIQTSRQYQIILKY